MTPRPWSNQYAGKTHCQRGHAFSPENTRLLANGWRGCRTCARASRRERERERRKRERDRGKPS